MKYVSYNNGKMEIPERIVVEPTGEIYFRDDNDNLSLLPTVKGGKEFNYDDCVVIEETYYKIKELVYTIHGEKCPYPHCVSQFTKKPEGMSKNDIRNLYAMTWREIWAWSSVDITPMDKKINKIIRDEKTYKTLLELKPLIRDERSDTFSISAALPMILKSFKNCDLYALSLLLDVVREDKEDLLAKSIPLILSTFRYNGKFGREENCDMDSLGILLHLVKHDKSNFITKSTPLILGRFSGDVAFDGDALKIILDLMKKDEDPSRLFNHDEEYKKTKPDNDFKGLDWIIEQN